MVMLSLHTQRREHQHCAVSAQIHWRITEGSSGASQIIYLNLSNNTIKKSFATITSAALHVWSK